MLVQKNSDVATRVKLNIALLKMRNWRSRSAEGNVTMRFACGVFLFLLSSCSGCAQDIQNTRLNKIYGWRAKSPDYLRNPVIVIPGVLGSKLVDTQTKEVVWGKFNSSFLPWRSGADVHHLAIPMRQNVPLSELRDTVQSDGTLAYLEVSLAGIPMEIKAYGQMLRTLGVGGYRAPDLPHRDSVDYGDEHFTCFQFDYDWRRDISETAVDLHAFIEAKRVYIRQEYERRYGIREADIKFEIVAHSMGGLVARYYLRYGGCPLPNDGSLPPLTWVGASNVSKVVMIGTPNAGSALAINDLVNGHKLAPLLPNYPPAVLGTMPSLYQLLPRERHAALVMAVDREPLPVLDPQLWQAMRWSLADPEQDKVLQKLMPDVEDRDARRAIALEHQAKCLVRATQFQAAMDMPAEPPEGLTLHLFAGDSIATPAVVLAEADGRIKDVENAAGDDTTLRTSALLDERTSQSQSQPLVTPIRWSTKIFLPRNHRALTSDPILMDNLLSLLLESSR